MLWERRITLQAGSCLARLTLQSQAEAHGKPLWVPSMEFSSWSLTQFLAVTQSLWVSRWNSRKVRHERGVLMLQGSRLPIPELLQGLAEPLAHLWDPGPSDPFPGAEVSPQVHKALLPLPDKAASPGLPQSVKVHSGRKAS